MAYQPTTWQNTPSRVTPLSAAFFNKMEQGIKTAHETADAAETPAGAQAKATAARNGATAAAKDYTDTTAAQLEASVKSTIGTKVTEELAGRDLLTTTDAEGIIGAKVDEEITALDLPPMQRHTSTNLLDKSTLEAGFTLSGSTGQPVASSFHGVSPFLPVDPSTAYSFSGVGRYALYDANKAFISSVGGDNNVPVTFTTTAATRFARFVVHTSYTDVAQVNRSATLLPFEPFTKRTTIPSLTVAADQAAFLESSKNLLDKLALVSGFSLNTANGQPAINPNNWLSPFIAVKPSTTYRAGNVARYAMYDKARNLISTAADPTAFTTTATTAFVRLVVNKANVDTAQLNEGSILAPYESFEVKVSGVAVPRRRADLTLADRFVIDAPLDAAYTAPTIPGYPTLQDTTTTHVMDWYNTLLAAHPAYVTKTGLGTSSDGVNGLFRFDFRPPAVPTTTVPTAFPKVLLFSGVHGYEKAAVHSLYRAMKALCEDWRTDPVLEALRHNFHFIVVPVGNPHSYNASNSTVGNVRRNANGVDIARNFPARWVLEPNTAADTYGGPAPLSEPETVILDQLMRDNKDAVWGASMHNFTAPENAPARFIWNAAATSLQANVAKRLIARLTRKWKAAYTWLPQDDTTYVGYADMESPWGSEGQQFAAYGIHGATFETSRILRAEPGATDHDSRALTLGLETTVNYLALGAAAGVADANARRLLA